MDQVDLSTVVLQLTALNHEAVATLTHPCNEAFLVPTASSVSKPMPRYARETTPLASNEPVRAMLRTDQYPFDPLLGWIFGRDSEECDFFLGTMEQGISRRQFRIDHNWKAKTLVLINMSGNGTSWTNPETGEVERVLTSRAILPGEQCNISAGVVDLVLRIPPRSEDQQASYDDSINQICVEVEAATPTINGLKIQAPGTATPMIVGRKRKFVLQNIIGTGAMALVYRATDYETGDTFAAKEYKLSENFEQHLSSMLNEIKILKKLKHVSSDSAEHRLSVNENQRNIIEYIEILRGPDPVLIMELAMKSLADVNMTRVSDCVTMLKDALAGLAHLHEKNIIHRDIKPGNILLTSEDPALWKLSDFGLSKIAEVTTTFLGTPLYLAPEMGGLEYSAYTAAVDLWALGIVGMEMLMWITVYPNP